MGMFCRLGLLDERRPVAVTVANEAITPGKAITVWHVQSDGTLAQVDGCAVYDGSVTFYATELGTYLVVNSSASP